MLSRRLLHTSRRALANAASDPTSSATSSSSSSPSSSIPPAPGQVFIPDLRVSHVERSPLIPTEPDNFTSAPSAHHDTSWPTFHAPRVHTVTFASTHLEGGPAAGGADDVHTAREGDNTKGVPKEEDVYREQRYEWEDRKLNSEERSGLIVLGGIVFGGWLLGGLGRGGPKQAKADHK